MSKKYNIAYLTLECLYKNTATCVHVTEVAQGLKQHGLGVTLYSPPRNDKIIKISLRTKLLYYFRIQLNLIRHIKKYDLIYIRSHYMAFPISIISKLFSIPVIQEVNGPYDDIFITHPWLRAIKIPLIFLQRLQYRHATHLLPVTHNLAKWLISQAHHNRCTVISNGANTNYFRPHETNKDINELESPYVIFYATMAKWHDLETAIKSTYEPNWPSGIKLMVIGESIDTEVKKYILNNNSNIIFLKKQEYKKIPSYISHALAGLVIMADPAGRAQKGLSPLKLYETLACGVPVIASDFPEQADFIRSHNCGIVVSPQNSAELADAVAFLAKNRELAKKLGNNGQKVVEKDYSWWKISQDINSIIIKSIKENRHN